MSVPSPVPPSAPPAPLTRFVGRQRELAEVRELVRAERLVSLTGAGGSGKTRLALEIVAGAVGDRPDGVVWVDLASVAAPDLIAAKVAGAAGAGAASAEGRDAIVQALRGRSSLLVLDSCEHLLDACAELVESLLHACPELHVLLTTREALGIAGEHAWHVPPLGLPVEHPSSVEALLSSEAARLFLDRAKAARADFAVADDDVDAVASICRRLDGIPLAIELAAARVRALSAEQIAARLDHAFLLLTEGSRTAIPRHRTLRAAIDWSYGLLTDPERIALARLSVFRGGFSLSAAEEVCGDPETDAFRVFDLVARLVDRSLVEVREGRGAVRYRLLETVRQYAQEQRSADGTETGLQRRHARHFVGLVRDAAPFLTTARRQEWVQRLTVDLDNVRAALAWSREHDPEIHEELAAFLADLERADAPPGGSVPEGAARAPEGADRASLEGAGRAPSTPARAPAAPPATDSAAIDPPAIEVRALGPLETHVEGILLGPDAWRLQKPRELLVHLLLHPNGRTREQLEQAFWPDASPAHAKNSFHVTLHHLRRAIGGTNRIVLDGGRYRVAPGLEVRFDVPGFEAGIAEALVARRRGEGSLESLRAVLELYRGEFLEGEPAGAWHLEPRDRLRALYLDGSLAFADALAAQERHGDAIPVLERVIAGDSLREEAHRALMDAQARAGRRDAALRHFDHLVRFLREELGSPPEPATTAVAERIRAGGGA